MSVMSLHRPTLRALLAVGLFAAVGGARADNECVPVGVSPADNGAAADAYVCETGFHPDGIAYVADGDLELTFTGSGAAVDLRSSGNISISAGAADEVSLIFEDHLIGGSASSWTIDLDIDGLARIENHGSISRSIQISSGDTPSTDAVIRAAGAGRLVIDNHDTLKGRVDFSNLDGGVSFNITGTSTGGTTSIYAPNVGWNTTGDSVFSATDDLLDIGAEGWLQTSSGGYLHPYVTNVPPPPVTTLDFGAGEDRLRNAGTFAAGTSNENCDSTSRCPPRASLTVFENLEVFENTGLILMGRGGGHGNQESPNDTDFIPDDRIVAHGVHFEGGAGSRIMLDANLGSGGQAGCGESLVADCLDFSGGSTAGSTGVQVRELFPQDRGDPADIVLVDVSGGASGAGHFVLDPASTRYSDAHGGVIDKGLLLYPLVYDPDAQQHVLKATPSDDAQQIPLMVEMAEAAWRALTPGAAGRQSAARDGASGAGGQLWLHGKVERGTRSTASSVMAADRVIAYDNTHDLNLSTLTIGLDRVFAHAGGAETSAGGMIGYVRGSADFAHSRSDAALDGVSLGAYGRHQRGAFHVDATLNMVWSEMDFTVPDLGLTLGETSNTMSADIESLGGEVEAGWTFNTGALQLTPVVIARHVRTGFDDMLAPSSSSRRESTVIDFGDNDSTQAGAGLRLSVDSRLGGLHASWRLRGELLQELDEESTARLSRGGHSLALSETQDGSIIGLSGGLGVRNASGRVSGFLDLDWLDRGDYDSTAVSLGFRYRW